MIGFVTVKRIPGAPAFDAMIVTIRTVISQKAISRADPAIQATQKYAITAMGTGIVGKRVVIGTALDEYATRIARMDFLRLAANPVVKFVFLDRVARSRPHFQTRFGTV